MMATRREKDEAGHFIAITIARISSSFHFRFIRVSSLLVHTAPTRLLHRKESEAPASVAGMRQEQSRHNRAIAPACCDVKVARAGSSR
jgi:hypothetical protein